MMPPASPLTWCLILAAPAAVRVLAARAPAAVPEDRAAQQAVPAGLVAAPAARDWAPVVMAVPVGQVEAATSAAPAPCTAEQTAASVTAVGTVAATLSRRLRPRAIRIRTGNCGNEGGAGNRPFPF